MAKVSLHPSLLSTIEELQADNAKGAKEEVAFIDDMISLRLVELSVGEGNFEKEYKKIQRLSGIRQYLQSFIPDDN